MKNLFFAFEDNPSALKDGVINATMLSAGIKINKGYKCNFTEYCLQDYADNAPPVLPMLRQHNNDIIVGSWSEWRYEDSRLKSTGKLLDDHTVARDTLREIEAGLLRGVSIGGGATKYTLTGPKSVNFDKMELEEASLVLSPRDKEAWIELSDDFEWPVEQVKPAKYIFTLPKNTAIFS